MHWRWWINFFTASFFLTIYDVVFHCILIVFRFPKHCRKSNHVWRWHFLFIWLLVRATRKPFRVGHHFPIELLNKESKHSSVILAALKGAAYGRQTLQIGSQQCYHRRPEMSCGLFVVSWKFLFATVSRTFSYLLILIQFDVVINYEST